MRFSAIIILAALLSSCNSFAPPTASQVPANPYMYYKQTGSEGNLVARIQNFTHPKTQNQVSLIGMIHIADPAYYSQIQKELDQSDIVLMEGVSGRGNFGIHHFFLTYFLAQQQRTADLAALLPQNYGLKVKENWQFADMSMEEFADQSNILYSLEQLITLPLAIVVIEPIYLSGRLLHGTSSLLGTQCRKSQELKIRNSIVNMIETKDPAPNVLPGIIVARNNKLIDEMKKVTALKHGIKIAIPWGAAHGPGLEKALLKEGYIKTNFKEISAINLKNFARIETNTQEAPQRFGIPYLGSWHKYKHASQLEFLFAFYSHTRYENYYSWNLLYEQLLLNTKGNQSYYLSLLPRIAGRAILFEYKRNEKKKNLCLLWFLKFDWE